MITTEIWGTMIDVNDPTQYELYETGEVITLTTDDMMITNGKYEGQKLSDVTDTHYLTWMVDKMKDDVTVQTFGKLRLEELK